MDLNLIRHFLMVYELQSITKAADALNITQPAVSSAIRRLEDTIDQRLFVKQGRSIAPTRAAHRLADEFQHALETIHAAVADKGDLVAYCSEAVLHLIGEMEGVTFRLPPHDEAEILADLRCHKVDMAIDVLTTRDKSFIIEDVFKESFVLVCRQGHPRIKQPITLEQFYAEQHIALTSRRHGRNAYELLLKEDPSQPRKEKIEVSSISGVAMLAASTDYLALISTSFSDNWSSKLGLQVFEPPMAFYPICYQLIFHKRHANDPRHSALCEKLKTSLRSLYSDS